MIEQETLVKAKSKPGIQEDQIEIMVKDEIQDQMTKIEDKKTQNEAYEVLLYGQDIDEKEQPQQSNDDLEKKAVASLINEDKQIEDEAKKRFEASQALQDEIKDDKAKEEDNYLSPATMNALKTIEPEDIKTKKPKKEPLSI